MKNCLKITNLHVSIKDSKKILNGISLKVKKGEIHAIMGSNGSGKSTFAKALMGSSEYELEKGKIEIDGIDVVKLSPDKRAKQGLFLGFQEPVEIRGVSFGSFLRMAVNEIKKDKEERMSPIFFKNLLTEKARELSFTNDLMRRALNDGFSGGEKKKAEILQLSFLRPKFAILDEPDSGLDIDGVKYVSKVIKSLNHSLGQIGRAHV